MKMSGKVRENFARYARSNQGPSGSLFIARMAQTLMDVLDDGSAFGSEIIGWPDTAAPDALTLRAIAGFHALLLSGRAPELILHFPPKTSSDPALAIAIAQTISSHDGFLTTYLDSPPQTNEVGRSALILGAALHVAAQTQLPISVFELGASAGLNLWFSDYAYDLGDGKTFGDARGAPIKITTPWTGNSPPLDAPLSVAHRTGCDQNPLNPGDPDHALRLKSYVWADQQDRLHRLQGALAYAAEQDYIAEQIDAALWVKREFSKPAAKGQVRMLYHTIVWQYLSPEVKATITEVMEQAGKAATANAPIAWFRFESDQSDQPGGRMELTIWPTGETVFLGRADYHGRWASWQ